MTEGPGVDKLGENLYDINLVVGPKDYVEVKIRAVTSTLDEALKAAQDLRDEAIVGSNWEDRLLKIYFARAKPKAKTSLAEGTKRTAGQGGWVRCGDCRRGFQPATGQQLSLVTPVILE